MLNVVAALAQAGPAEGFGDDDGGRLWNPRRNRTEHMTDPLALGALIYSREFSAARSTEEAIWLFGSQAVDMLSPEPSQRQTATPVHSIAFPDGGLYILADSDPCAQAMVVDAGPQGEGRSGHGHADALSLRLTIGGHRWLVDAGSGVYIAKDPADRNTLRGTGAHNTMRVDGADQAVADEPFSWTHIPSTLAENWITGKGFTYFVGSHNGYTRLEKPVVHQRHVLKIAGGVCLVRDLALGRGDHELEIRWHFASDLEVRAVTSRRVDISRTGALPDEPWMSLIVPEEAAEDAPENTAWPTTMEVTKTLISPSYGALQSAPLVRCSAPVSLPAETATALIARPGILPPQSNPRIETRIEQEVEARLIGMAQPDVQVYELDYHGESHEFFFARGEAWGFGPWSSDARVLYCRIENEKLAQLVVIGGTHVGWQGQPLLQAAGPSDFFEWRRQDAVMSSAPAGFSATHLFKQLADGSRSFSANLNRSSSSPGSSGPGSSNQGSSPYAEKH
jgi:hypothetical protein